MQAIILCGGKGERLNPLTNNCPKGMIKIEGRPLLEYHLQWLKKNGITNIVFACGYLSEQIQDYFGDGRKFLLNIDYSIEKEQLGRGGAIKKAWDKLEQDKPFIVTNGDIYTEMDLQRAIKVHLEKKNIKATICLFPYRSSYGIVGSNHNDLVEKFEEKPMLPFWINGGIYFFEYDIRDDFPDNGDHEVTTFLLLIQRGLLSCYKSNEFWRSIETTKDLNEFSNHMRASLVGSI